MKKSKSLLGCEVPGVVRETIQADVARMPGFVEMTQIAVITPDTPTTVADLCAALGAGSFKVVDMGAPALFEATYGGEPSEWSMRAGVSWIGNTQIEVIQPLGGRTLFADYLEKRGGRPGVQHVYLERGDIGYRDSMERFAEHGWALMQHAKMNAAGKLGKLPMPAMPDLLAPKYATRFGYIGTLNDLKIDIELARFPKGVTQRLALRAAIPDKWHPEGDDAHFESAPPDAFMHDVDGAYIFTEDLESLVAAYGKLCNRPPEVHAYTGDLLPGEGRLASIGFDTTYLHLVQPTKGGPLDLLQSGGEGCRLLHGRTALSLEEAQAGMEARGWSVNLEAPTGSRGTPALFGVHPKVPFGLWVQ